jgi:predicted nucleotidyltransferase
MSSRAEASMQIENSLTDYFRTQAPGVAAAYLFGSQTSGGGTPTSDVDIAVLFAGTDRESMQQQVEEILSALSRLLRRDIHPVIMNSAGEALLKQILSKGRCIFVSDERKLAEFKMVAYARIADFHHRYLKRMQAATIRRVLEAGAHG